MPPKVSIVVSTFNGERFIREAVASLLSQTFCDLELIVLNDGSTDQTAEALRSFKDSRLVVVENDRNRGIAESQNMAISLARGDYVALQDHDDVSLPNRLEKQVTFLQSHRHIALVGSYCVVIDAEGKRVGQLTVPSSDIDLKWSVLTHNPFLHTSVMFRRNVLDSVALYSPAPEFRYAEDFEFTSRLAAQHAVANIPEPLVKWRSYDAQTSVRHIRIQEQSAMNIAVRNTRCLLGDKAVKSVEWFALKKLLRAKSSEKVSVSEAEVHNSARLISVLQKTFYRKYGFSSGLVAEHSRKLSRLIGRHFVALAYRRNKKIDLASRLALLTAGNRFLVQAFRTGSDAVMQ